MDTNESGGSKGCPYFLPDMKACGLHSEGIYLPPRAHVLTYCLTTSYRNCSTYERYCLSGSIQGHESARSPEGRRRHARIERQKEVLIRTCNMLGIVNGGYEEKVVTVDYSRGGMRLVLEKKLPTGSLVLFNFDEDFPVPRLQGIAELCWHRKRPGSSADYEAGLEFKDHFSRAALAVELGK